MKHYKYISNQLEQVHEKFETILYDKMSISYKGIYGITIDVVMSFQEFNIIPEHEDIFRHIDNIPYNPALLYIGSAKKPNSTIGKRLFGFQLGGKLIHEDPSTFRAIFYRKLGSVLGFISPTPQKNFRFNSTDDVLMRSWIKKHLKVKYFDMDNEINEILPLEKKLINEFKPPFNFQHNPDKCDALTSVYRKNNK